METLPAEVLEKILLYTAHGETRDRLQPLDHSVAWLPVYETVERSVQ